MMKVEYVAYHLWMSFLSLFLYSVRRYDADWSRCEGRPVGINLHLHFTESSASSFDWLTGWHRSREDDHFIPTAQLNMIYHMS